MASHRKWTQGTNGVRCNYYRVMTTARQDDDNIAPLVGMRKREIKKRRPEQTTPSRGKHRNELCGLSINISDNILAPWSVGDSSAMFSKRFG